MKDEAGREIRIRAHSSPWRAAIELLITDHSFGRYSVGEIVFTVQDEAAIPDASLRLTEDEAQTLMDDLWNCGIRPTDGAGSAGAMAATQKHLEDMRRLVFEEREKAWEEC